MAMNDQPIGVFDSGMGGLTVLHALAKALPNERFIYVGDTARVPYGSRSKETIRRYSVEIASFLVRTGVKYLVIACNTSTAHAEELLRQTMPVPVIGVITPGVEALVNAVREVSATVGVLGTRSTVKSNAYPDRIANIRPDLKVLSRACPLFVPLVEEGWTNNQVTEQVIREYLDDLVQSGMTAAVLGCTHYPLLKSAISKVYPDLKLIDSSKVVADAVAFDLEKRSLLHLAKSDDKAQPLRILLTDVTEHEAFLEKLFLGIEIGIEELPIDRLKSE